MSIRSFVDEHYRHFNAGTVARASSSLVEFLDEGGRIFLTLAGAMSTAEIGRSLAGMIRAGHIAAISCTGANLEEDVFNLVAHDAYVKVANHEDLSPEDEAALLERKLNRVTDVCIPEDAAIRAIEHHLMGVWRSAQESSESLLPHEHLYCLLRSGALEDTYQADPRHSWLLAAAEVNLPLYRPGVGGFYAGQHLCCSLFRRAPSSRCGAEWDSLHDGPDDVLPFVHHALGVSSVRWGHCGGFPHLRGALAPPRFEGTRRATLVVVLPNHGRHRLLRRLLWRTAQRENHVGKTGCCDAEVQHSKRCNHRAAPHVRLCS